MLDVDANSHYSDFDIDITVSCIDPAGAASNSSKYIKITITTPTKQTLVFSAFRADL